MSLITLDPTGTSQAGLFSVAPRLRTLEGATIGILYNRKPNGRELLTRIVDLLASRYHSHVLEPVQTANAQLASLDQLLDLTARSNYILTGLGD